MTQDNKGNGVSLFVSGAMHYSRSIRQNDSNNPVISPKAIISYLRTFLKDYHDAELVFKEYDFKDKSFGIRTRVEYSKFKGKAVVTIFIDSQQKDPVHRNFAIIKEVSHIAMLPNLSDLDNLNICDIFIDTTIPSIPSIPKNFQEILNQSYEVKKVFEVNSDEGKAQFYAVELLLPYRFRDRLGGDKIEISQISKQHNVPEELIQNIYLNEHNITVYEREHARLEAIDVGINL